ncbi:class I SAM-dependent methyltransferase [Bosea sp. BH3]|uniref:class I SAM-dependent methyltransferase n=1 Tax=Bosea sp. BH3 TaxID=2871701 RepID=UPI0021CB6E2D|nr:class I SAM-dependent methyltransferase [Bosea sp. BH3]MCU4180675.1 class I SAM-dependent methyltransferase [Bosea sp. BH3]
MTAQFPTCPLCSSQSTSVYAKATDIEYFTSDDVYDIRACDECGILFVDPMRSQELNKIYPKNYYSFQNNKKNLVVQLKEWLDRRALRQLTQQIPGQELSILDIGGGTGWLVDQVKRADSRVARGTVIDIDDGAKEIALRNGHDFFLGRFEAYEVADRQFDLILMLNLIEHVADPHAVMAKAARLLSPNGLIWIKTPNFDSLDARIFRHQSWAGYHTPRHFVIFKKESLERLSDMSGLRLRSFAYTQGAPFWSASLLALLQRMKLVRVSASRPAIYHPLMPILQAVSAAFDFVRRPFGAKLSQMVLTLELNRDMDTSRD